MLVILNWIFCLGSAALILFASGNDLFEPAPAKVIYAPIERIESPLQNNCQSGDLLPDLPKCKWSKDQ
jgi:hypothetical protein